MTSKKTVIRNEPIFFALLAVSGHSIDTKFPFDNFIECIQDNHGLGFLGFGFEVFPSMHVG